MLLTLKNDHKEHLSYLIDKPNEVLIDFCKLAINFLLNGADLKLYNMAAQKLGVDVTVIQNTMYGLINLLLECNKHNLNEADFRDSVLTIGYSLEQQGILYKFYQSKKNEICEALEKLSVDDLHYNNLEWRFEALISSRCLLHRTEPLIAMDLTLKKPQTDKIEHIILQTDPINLIHVTKQLENCLQESRSRQTRKIQKTYFKINN